jgi:hypothetical protein
MKFLDKIALNRLIAIITSFILSIIKIFAPKNTDLDLPEPPLRKKRKDRRKANKLS